jgi:flavodoxin
MKILVVYDSVFGNTEKIARAIGAALGMPGDVETQSVNQVSAEKLGGLDLLVVGSPTRGFRPTEAVSKLLKALPKDQLAGIRVATFDTRIALETINSAIFRFIVDKSGYAAGKIANILKKKGGNLVAPPEGFIVTASEGPLKPGEIERAAEWARKIVAGK